MSEQVNKIIHLSKFYPTVLGWLVQYKDELYKIVSWDEDSQTCQRLTGTESEELRQHIGTLLQRTDNEEEEVTLTFKGPETDFDMGQIEAALYWLKEKYASSQGFGWTSQSDKVAMRSIYALLLTIQHQYAEKLGEPTWKLSPLT